MKTARHIPAALKFSRRRAVLSFAAAVLSLGAVGSARADTYNFVLTGTPEAWNTGASWTNTSGGAGLFPNAAGDVANFGVDLTTAEVVYLNQPITIGTLNFGDTGAGTAPVSTTIATSASVNLANTLTFQSATAGGATAINVSTAGTAGVQDIIQAPIVLGGTSPLTITANGLQTFNMSSGSSINAGTNTLTLSTTNTGSGGGVTINNLSGTGNLVKTGVGRAFFNGTVAGTANFTGATIINAGILTVQNGPNLNSPNITINTTGTLELGSISQTASNVTTSATIALNGGAFNYRGSSAAGATTQTLNTISLAQGSSVISTLAAAANQTVVSAGTLNRAAGATLLVQGDLLGQSIAGSTRIIVTGTAPTLVGGTGGAGTTTIPIVPYAVGASAAAGTGTIAVTNDLVTYDATLGFRPLVTGEYATFASINGTNSPTSNVITPGTAVAVAASTTLNGLKVTGSNANGAVTIASGQILTVASGALSFSANTESIAGAGTLNFGAAEGVVSVSGTNTGTVSTVITGSGGFTKGGTGSLTLNNTNTFSGQTTVAGGTLLTGAAGNLGTGNTLVARGGALTLGNNTSINDAASLLLNSVSTVNLSFTGTETISGLSLDSGATFLTPGMTYDATTLNAFGLTTFTGAGTLTITAVPEPSEWAMVGIGAALFAVAHRRRLLQYVRA